jgi:hypothetical protein
LFLVIVLYLYHLQQQKIAIYCLFYQSPWKRTFNNTRTQELQSRTSSPRGRIWFPLFRLLFYVQSTEIDVHLCMAITFNCFYSGWHNWPLTRVVCFGLLRPPPPLQFWLSYE